MSEKKIIDLKRTKNIQIVTEIRKALIIKFILFYIFDFLFLLIFWYYLGCFCAVFKNIQFFLIKDTLLSFILSLMYPFVLNLLPGLFRIPSLKNKMKCVYYMSKIIQNI